MFEEGRRGGIAGLGDRLRAQRPGRTRLQWRHLQTQLGARRCRGLEAAADVHGRMVCLYEVGGAGVSSLAGHGGSASCASNTSLNVQDSLVVILNSLQ